MGSEKMSMEVINLHSAGIDVGSRSHFVAVGQGANDVKEFSVYAVDLKEMANWLAEKGVTTVAMESTGQYWQNLFVELMNSGLEVILTNGKFTKKYMNLNKNIVDINSTKR